jgi:primosomal protein N' (replication factor Y)
VKVQDVPLPFARPDPSACYVGVALDVPVDQVFTYRVPERLVERARPGHRVTVSFRRRPHVGFIVERQHDPGLERVLDVKDVPDEAPLLDAALLDLGRFVARHYGASYGECLAAMVPRGVRRKGKGRRQVRVVLVDPEAAASAIAAEETGPRARVLRQLQRGAGGIPLADLCRRARVSPSPIETLARRGVVRLEAERVDADPLTEAAEAPARSAPPPTLEPDQEEAVTRVADAVAAARFAPFLLLGVTGSGKTEVYLRGIAEAVARGRQAIVLVPEIALTPQTVRRFRARFERVAVLHSGLTDAERSRAWRRIRAGEVDVVVGPRSAVFAPVPHLGILVVDEEHEGSFKQQSAPRYHARDVGLVRAREAGAVALLGSATPSLESWRHAEEGRYGLLRLPRRIGGRPMPEVHVVDLTSPDERPPGRGHLSRTLRVRIHQALADRGQVILLQNRRGFATSVACPRCGWVLECLHCDLSLTWHRVDDIALCHVCGHERRAPTTCPDCALPGLKKQGVGTQTVESELATHFPEARVARMDSDSMTTRGAYEDVLGRFGRRELDVLVGTQMIAKGLHFPHVTLVGIVSADTALALPDFRSTERTFSLVAQVAGRAGRGEAPGRVVVQTLVPDHPAIRLAATHDFEGFASLELADRKRFGYPPFLRLLHVVVRGAVVEAVEARAEETAGRLVAAALDGVEVLGPAVPSVARLQGLTRRHVLVKGRTPAAIARALHLLRAAPRAPTGVEEILDVDPLSIL